MTWRQKAVVVCTAIAAPYLIFTDEHPLTFLKVRDFDLAEDWWVYLVAAVLLFAAIQLARRYSQK